MIAETVLVTGASSGIGLELARCFAADGSRLILLARRAEALREVAAGLKRDFGAEAEVCAADLGRPETPAELFERFGRGERPVDVLVNNAGFGARGRFAELPLERQLAMLQVNITALMHLTRLFLPGLVERRGGGVLNVASTAAFAPGAGMAVYYASKAFVLSFTEAVAEEVAGTGVTVTALCPGPTETNFVRAANAKDTALFKRAAMSAEAVARIGHRDFRRGRVVSIAGARNKLMTFGVRLAPRAVVRRMTAKVNIASFEPR